MRLKISGGRLFDPACGWHGEARDLHIEGDRIVTRLAGADRVMDARGKAVVAAGLDLRGQVATYGLNFRRAAGGMPSLRELGESYAALGYTHVHEPFLTLATANYVHCQLAALPLVDASASLVVNLRDLDLWLRSPEQWSEVGETLLFLLDRTRSLNLRVVEPFVRYRQEVYAPRTMATERALEILAHLAHQQKLPVTLEASPEVLRAGLPEPRVFHLAALGPALVADDLLEVALAHLERGVSADMGLMVSPAGGSGREAPGLQVDLGWFRPLELTPVPDEAAARRALALALQYQGDRLAFSGAGSWLAPVEDYPRLFAWLRDRAARQRDWGGGLDHREYSLSRWVWATRNLPASLLGLKDRGRLCPGARADVAIYDLPPDTGSHPWPGRCRTLLKAGEVVVEDYRLVQPDVARATYCRQTGAGATPLLQEICQYRSLRPENLWVLPELAGEWKKI
jgi:hypothetical protein